MTGHVYSRQAATAEHRDLSRTFEARRPYLEDLLGIAMLIRCEIIPISGDILYWYLIYYARCHMAFLRVQRSALHLLEL